MIDASEQTSSAGGAQGIARDGGGRHGPAQRVLPEKIPDGGLVILRDGDPGEPEQALGDSGNTYYQHGIEIEVYVEEGDAAARDAAFDDLLQQIGAVLEADPALDGLAFGLTYGRPEPAVEAIAGAPAIKAATLTVTVDYELKPRCLKRGSSRVAARLADTGFNPGPSMASTASHRDGDRALRT